MMGSDSYSKPTGPAPAQPADLREPSFGEKAVGITFNPSGNADVENCKKQFAQVIDNLNALRMATTSAEVKRMCSVAITDAQSAQMWAVKAITWKD